MGSDVTYVLFLDDDISVHPGTVQLLVDTFRDRPKVGYLLHAATSVG